MGRQRCTREVTPTVWIKSFALQIRTLEVYTNEGESTSGRKPTFLLRLDNVCNRRPSKAFAGTIRAMAVDLEAIRLLAERVVVSQRLILFDVELKGGGASRLLRVYIDKPGGVTHEDCRRVSEDLSVLLDVEDPIPGHYTLEVSSPGLDRELTRPHDYEYFVGRQARLVLREPLERQRVLEGRLAGFSGNAVKLEAADGTVREVQLDNISRARLLVDF